MGGEAFGLVTPSVLYLADEDDELAQPHPEYNPALDSVRTKLQQEGRRTISAIRGNLPFGYGFASSSALALLHLRPDSPTDASVIVDRLDSALHGFAASGVDVRFYLRGRAGLYRAGVWHDTPDPQLCWSCALLPKEARFTLPEARKLIRRRKESLAAQARLLTEGLLRHGTVSHDRLRDYAWELLRSGAYSADAQRVITLALEEGIVAKGIGGLYDKAILFLNCQTCCSASADSLRLVQAAISTVRGAVWLESA